MGLIPGKRPEIRQETWKPPTHKDTQGHTSKHKDKILVLASLSSALAPSSLHHMGGFVWHRDQQPVRGWLLNSFSPFLHVLTVLWEQLGEATQLLTLVSSCWQNWPRHVVCQREGKLGSDVPSWCKHSKASGSQGPSSNPRGHHFSLCDLFHKIKQHVFEYISFSLCQLFRRACAHFLYTAGPSRGITRVF